MLKCFSSQKLAFTHFTIITPVNHQKLLTTVITCRNWTEHLLLNQWFPLSGCCQILMRSSISKSTAGQQRHLLTTNLTLMYFIVQFFYFHVCQRGKMLYSRQLAFDHVQLETESMPNWFIHAEQCKPHKWHIIIKCNIIYNKRRFKIGEHITLNKV